MTIAIGDLLLISFIKYDPSAQFNIYWGPLDRESEIMTSKVSRTFCRVLNIDSHGQITLLLGNNKVECKSVFMENGQRIYRGSLTTRMIQDERIFKNKPICDRCSLA